jgi:hypothetical protein
VSNACAGALRRVSLTPKLRVDRICLVAEWQVMAERNAIAIHAWALLRSLDSIFAGKYSLKNVQPPSVTGKYSLDVEQQSIIRA